MSIGDYSGGRAGIYIMHELSAAWTHLTVYLVAVGLDTVEWMRGWMLVLGEFRVVIGPHRTVYHFLSFTSQCSRIL